MNSSTLVIMGNGPSLKDINFDILRKVDTFGLNAAYRAYDKLNFWPTYFGCFDLRVVDSHIVEYQQLIKYSPIKKLFFCTGKNPLLNFNDKYQYINYKFGRVNTPQYTVDKTKIPNSFDKFWIYNCSGATAALIGMTLGYKKIILVGVDASYVNLIDGAQYDENGNKFDLIITKDIKNNPNYWFDNYQQIGDKYHVPNSDIYHIPEWNKLAELAKNHNIDIVNCSTKTKLTCFRRSELEKEISM